MSKIDKESTIIQPGSVILRCKPFAYSLNLRSVSTYCDACFKSSKERLDGESHSRCSGCHVVLYCDRACQKIGWHDGHKWECKGFKSQGKAASPFARLVLRVICRLQTGSDYYDLVPPKTHRRFKDLVSHYGDVKKDATRMEQVRTIEKVVESILTFHNKIKMPNESEFTALCGRLFVNTFSICNQEFHDLGTGLYIGASIFDHSCEPMAVATFHSTTIEIRNIVPILANFPIDKITICYQDVLKPSTVRINELRKAYYFECQCERCSRQKFDSNMLSVYCSKEEDDEVTPNRPRCEVNLRHYDRCPKCSTEFSPEYIRRVKETEDMVFAKINEMSTITYLDVCESCISVMKSLNFSDTHWMMSHMAFSAFEACIDKEYWEKAFLYGTLALKGQRKYLLGFNPYLGITYTKMAKLSWFLEKDTLAKEYIMEAYKIINVTHGVNSEIVQNLIRPLVQEISATTDIGSLQML